MVSKESLWRQHPVQELGLLVDGDDYYREFYRAALTAQKSILITGWQFDSEVPLLRGKDAEAATAPVALLKFLNHLCETKPDLRIYLLAWDFHLIFAAEREWMQQVVFQWNTNPRLVFQFDASHAEGGCHHQKFVVIDGEVSFLGGIDLAEDRWDDRKHLMPNPLRMSRGKPHKPFHDIQAYLRGRELAASLTELFTARWTRAGGEAIPPEQLTPEAASTYVAQNVMPLSVKLAGLNRTDPNAVPEGEKPCLEILRSHEEAIAGAQQIIYAETQYMSSHLITEALERRMRQAELPKLELVFILNMRGETLKEQAAVGLAQAQNIGRLRKTAEETGHRLGLYYTNPHCHEGEEPERATYIHSKLMIVDDRVMLVGSANLTNRSMGVDSELNLVVDAGASAAAARRTLLAEHTGGPELDLTEGLVAKLDAIAAGEGGPCRLKRHPSPTPGEQTALSLVDPQKLPWDPDHAEPLDDEQHTDFLAGIGRTVRELLG